MQQGSEEWRQARLGCVTASRVADVIARTKTDWGASRKNYAAELIVERLTGVPTEGYTNAAMQFGLDNEAQARAAYSFCYDADVIEVGFIPHPTIPISGCSPDGLIGTDGLVEIKVPNSATHIETLLGSEIPDKYIVQMQFQMACTGAKWADFVSFDPRMPARLSLYVKRIQRDDKRIAELEALVKDFLAELDAKLAALNALGNSTKEPAVTSKSPPLHHADLQTTAPIF